MASSSSHRPEFLDRLADLVPPPRKHRHRYHGVFAPNHKLRKAVTALAIGNIGKRCDAASGGHGNDGRASAGCCDVNQKPRSHDTSRIAWAKVMARVGEEFPLECPNCGGDIRLIAFITQPGPIRRILTHLGEPLERPPDSERLRAAGKKATSGGRAGVSGTAFWNPGSGSTRLTRRSSARSWLRKCHWPLSLFGQKSSILNHFLTSRVHTAQGGSAAERRM
jgi:hypothetical protein